MDKAIPVSRSRLTMVLERWRLHKEDLRRRRSRSALRKIKKCCAVIESKSLGSKRGRCGESRARWGDFSAVAAH